jgi:formylglycine-generating enzyme required for sulfatase activity
MHELELTFERTTSGWTATLRACGEPQRLAASAISRAGSEVLVDDARALRESPSGGGGKDFGARLFEMLSSGVGDAAIPTVAGLLLARAETRVPHRMLIRVGDAAELSALPWETLAHVEKPNGKTKTRAFFSEFEGNHAWSLVRHVPPAVERAPVRLTHRLRVLVLVGRGPFRSTGDASIAGIESLRGPSRGVAWPIDVHVAGTTNALAGVFGRPRAKKRAPDTTEIASAADVQALLRPNDPTKSFQVVHYIGHSHIDETDRGRVATALDFGPDFEVKLAQLADWLKKEPLRLLTLACCALDQLGAETLLHGAEHVIGFHAMAPGLPGDDWCRAFYTALRATKPIDEAVGASRKQFHESLCPWIVGQWSRVIPKGPFFSPDEIHRSEMLDEMRVHEGYQSRLLTSATLLGPRAGAKYVPVRVVRIPKENEAAEPRDRESIPEERFEDEQSARRRIARKLLGHRELETRERPRIVDPYELLGRPGRFLLESDMGYGKSTLLRAIAWRELERGDRFPIYVPLAAWKDSDMELSEFVASYLSDDEEVSKRRPGKPPSGRARSQLLAARAKVVEAEIESGRALLLLDALDEWDDRGITPRDQARLHTAVQAGGRCAVLLSSRTGRRESLPDGALAYEWLRIHEVDNATEQRSFLELYLGSATRSDGKSADQMLALLATDAYRDLSQLVNNPFVLSLCAFVYAETPLQLPAQLHELYSKAVERLVERGDKFKDADPRRPWARLREDQRELLRFHLRGALEGVAWWMFEGRTADGTVDDGKRTSADARDFAHVFRTELARLARRPRVSERACAAALDELCKRRLVQRTGDSYALLHRSVLEYLAACWLTPRGAMDLSAESRMKRRSTDLREIASGRVWRENESWEIVLRFALERVRAGIDGGSPARSEDLLALTVEREFNPESRVSVEKRLRVAEQVLAPLGDPRLVESRRWVTIPPGPFFWGAGRVYPGGRTPVSLGPREDWSIETIPFAYDISRWPVTISEWRDFASDFGTLGTTDRQQLLNAWVPRMQAEDARGVYAWVERRMLETKDIGDLASWEVQLKLPPAAANHPMTRISFWDSCWYCAWMTSRCHGYLVRPPSDREWEKASRTGQKPLKPIKRFPWERMDTSEKFPWGDDPVDGRANTRENNLGRTSPVGVFVLGHAGCGHDHSIFDMSGNASEWCGESSDINLLATLERHGRVIRGGDWASTWKRAVCSNRSGAKPWMRSDSMGFRPVRVLAV